MVHASDLCHLSITGRYAFALACLEQLCAAWRVDDPFVLGEIDAHWQATEIPKVCRWFDTYPFPGRLEKFTAQLRPGGLSADQVQSLYHAFREARMVSCVSCYAANNDAGSMQALLNVVGVLLRWGIALPPLEHFRHATWSGDFQETGWGARLPRSSFAG
jgi:hypothetical protein